MNTFLNSAQETQVEQYRVYAREAVAPVAGKLAAHEICLREFLQQLAGKGYLGINVPKEYGGQGGTLLDVALFAEAIGHYEPGLALTLGDHAAVVELLKRYGTDQQKSRYLPTLARGEGFATLAFSEETAGTDFEAVQATLNGEAVTGKKTWVVTGDFATLLLTLVKDGDKLALVLLERPADSTFKLLAERRLMGLTSAYVNDIEFAGAKVAPENRFAEKSNVSDVVVFGMSVAKVVLSAGGLGLLEKAIELSVEHAKERNQFGKNIGSFQGVQWKLADMGAESTGARLQVYRAAWSLEGDYDKFVQNSAMCKLFTGRAGRLHSGEAVQVMGASGIVEGSILSRFYGDAKVMEIAQGTSEFQKMLLVKTLNI